MVRREERGEGNGSVGKSVEKRGNDPFPSFFMARLIGKFGGSILSPDPLTQWEERQGSHLQRMKTSRTQTPSPFALVPGKTLPSLSPPYYLLITLWLVRPSAKFATTEHVRYQPTGGYIHSTYLRPRPKKSNCTLLRNERAELLLGWMLSLLADP